MGKFQFSCAACDVQAIALCSECCKRCPKCGKENSDTELLLQSEWLATATEFTDLADTAAAAAAVAEEPERDLFWCDRGPLVNAFRKHSKRCDGSITLFCTRCCKKWDTCVLLNNEPIDGRLSSSDVRVIGDLTFLRPFPPRACDKPGCRGWLAFGHPNQRERMANFLKKAQESMEMQLHETVVLEPAFFLGQLERDLLSSGAMEDLLELPALGATLARYVPDPPYEVWAVQHHCDLVSVSDAINIIVFMLDLAKLYVDIAPNENLRSHRWRAVQAGLSDSLDLYKKLNTAKRYVFECDGIYEDIAFEVDGLNSALELLSRLHGELGYEDRTQAIPVLPPTARVYTAFPYGYTYSDFDHVAWVTLRMQGTGKLTEDDTTLTWTPRSVRLVIAVTGVPPLLFELPRLHGEISNAEMEMLSGVNTKIMIELTKKEPGVWGRLVEP